MSFCILQELLEHPHVIPPINCPMHVFDSSSASFFRYCLHCMVL
uniref:Uncharacterized protein n=1 Tax=Rhizophora mucronata TaxID=61149 RepID=A0A2P2J3I9_RHIMU